MENRNLQRQAKEQQRKRNLLSVSESERQGRAQEAVSPKDTVFQ